MAVQAPLSFTFGNGNPASYGQQDQIFHLSKELLLTANQVNYYQQFASARSMPQNSGKEWRIHRWFSSYERNPNDPDFNGKGFISSRDIKNIETYSKNAVLAEGELTGNTANTPKSITISATLQKYGEYVTITEQTDLFSADGKLNNVMFAKDLAENAAQRYDDLVQMDMLATTNVFYAGTATSMETLGKDVLADGTIDDLYCIDYDTITQITQKLGRHRVKPHTSLITASQKIETKPCEESFYAICGEEVYHNIRELTRGRGFYEQLEFVPVHKYASMSGNIAAGEKGRIGGLCFIVAPSSFVYRAQGAEIPQNYTGSLIYEQGVDNKFRFNVYPILIPGKEAFATVSLKGTGKIDFHYHSPRNRDHVNKQGDVGFISYNFWYASAILQEEKLLKVLTLAKSNNY